MKLVTVKVRSIRLLLIFLFLLISFLFLIDILSVCSIATSKIFDNSSRIDFIKSLGINPNENLSEEKEIFIPEKFTDVWQRYNQIQISAGYDLSLYSGKKAKMYRYEIPNFNGKSNVYINLIILDGMVIGGDISSLELNGFMLPLKEFKIEN